MGEVGGKRDANDVIMFYYLKLQKSKNNLAENKKKL